MFITLDRVTTGIKGTTFAYIAETSWPSQENIPRDALDRRVKQVVDAQPERVVTTQEIFELASPQCPNTEFIIDKYPCIKFLEMASSEMEEPKPYCIRDGVTLFEKCYVGRGTVIEPGTVIGGSSIGADMIDGVLVRRKQFGGVIIGESCHISPNCSIERGSFNDTIIGNNCLIDSGVKISHNVVLEDNVVILGNSTLAGHCKIEKNAYISCNCYIHRGVTIGSGSIVGPGSIVRHDVPAGVVIAGNPPKILRRTTEV